MTFGGLVMKMKITAFAFFCLIIMVGHTYADESTITDIYEQLILWEYSAKPVAVPSEGIEFKKDDAIITLKKGKFWLMKPVLNGKVTGLVFEGEGTFFLPLPDPIERANYERHSKKGLLNRQDISLTIKKCVIRTTENIFEHLQRSDSQAYKSHKLAKKVSERWLKDNLTNTDSRILFGLECPGDEYFLIDFDSREEGWVHVEFDGLQREEIKFQKMQDRYNYVETWVSLDRKEHRTKEGKPSFQRNDNLDVLHLDIEADLTERSKKVNRSIERFQPVTGKFRSTITFQPGIEGTRAIRFQLARTADITMVKDPVKNVELHYVRERIGEKYTSVLKKYFEPMVTIFYDEPLKKDTEYKIVIEYDLDIINFVTGRQWYPFVRSNPHDLYTGRLSITLPTDKELRAMGENLSVEEKGDEYTSVWDIKEPAEMIGFAFGKGFYEESVSLDNVPEIIAFGEKLSVLSGDVVKSVAVDVAKSIEFFQDYFGVSLEMKKIYASRITGFHGQAFHGFLQLSEFTFSNKSPGATEMFRAHEAAHQFWGHLVNWKTYRDQWISEAFAEYSAMLFIEKTMPETDYFQEIIDVKANGLIGSIRSAMSKFSRPWNIIMDPHAKKHLGPIGLGYRASASLIPHGYIVQCYHKGPLVLHMLRQMLKNETGNDELFREILSSFLKEKKGQLASTEDFREIIEKKTGKKWDWFFAQWIDDVAIPTYIWDYSVKSSAGGAGAYSLKVTVKQENVADSFTMPVPIAITDKAGLEEIHVIQCSGKNSEHEILLDSYPETVNFNPDFAVLAKVKKK